MAGTIRIWGYVAKARNVIVLLARTSSKVTYLTTLEYDTRSFSFKVGSRFYGKIYTERCDISPDGKHFLYFAMGRSQKQYTRKLYCWTAICTPPDIKAKVLFAHHDTQGGGGRFVDEKTIVIEPGMTNEFDATVSQRFEKYQVNFGKVKEPGGWLAGPGWDLIATQIGEHGPQYPLPRCWSKTIGAHTIRRYFNRAPATRSRASEKTGQHHPHEYSLLRGEQGSELFLTADGAACDWADLDNFGRIVVSNGGQLQVYDSVRQIEGRRPQKSFDVGDLIAAARPGGKSLP